MPMTVHDRAPRLRDCRRAEPGAAGFAGWVEGAGIALPGGAAPAARAWRGACVQRSAQARVSRQYHRMSSHALPPSGIIWSWVRGMPHSQHEITAACRAAGPVGEEVPVASAMICLTSASRAAFCACGVGQPQEPAPTAAAPAVLACALRRPREMPRWALTRRPASVCPVGLFVIPARCSLAKAARAALPPYAVRAAPSQHPRFRVSASGDSQQTKPAGADIPSANPAGSRASCAGFGWEGRRRPGGSRRRTGWS